MERGVTIMFQCLQNNAGHVLKGNMCAPSTPAHCISQKKRTLFYFFLQKVYKPPIHCMCSNHIIFLNADTYETTTSHVYQPQMAIHDRTVGNLVLFFNSFLNLKKKEKRREYLNFYAHGSSNSSVLCEKETPTVVQYRCPSSVQLVVGYTLVTMQFPCQQDLA